MPIQLYVLEVCSLSKRKLLSLGFTVLFKLLRASTIDIIKDRRDVFGVTLPSVQLTRQLNLNEPTIALI